MHSGLCGSLGVFDSSPALSWKVSGELFCFQHSTLQSFTYGDWTRWFWSFSPKEPASLPHPVYVGCGQVVRGWEFFDSFTCFSTDGSQWNTTGPPHLRLRRTQRSAVLHIRWFLRFTIFTHTEDQHKCIPSTTPTAVSWSPTAVCGHIVELRTVNVNHPTPRPGSLRDHVSRITYGSLHSHVAFCGHTETF